MLPKWMQRAIKEQVLSEAEAREWHAICLSAETEEVSLPAHLHNAAERVWLWELPARTSIH